MHQILETIKKIGIVPVIAIDDVSKALPLAKALCDGGLPCAEVTFRTAAAAEAIQIMSKNFPQMLIGAGTILTTQQADEAVAAGATFLVSPGLNPKVVAHSQKLHVPILPGCANPSDIETALELGLEVVKFFPAEAAGGLPMIKAMSAPYGAVSFMPTGGITPDNMLSYLDFPKVIACGGSWMVTSDLINQDKFTQIRDLAAEAITKMLNFKLAHVGLNFGSESEAFSQAETLASVFSFPIKNGNSSIFSGSGIELNKYMGLGEKGHIAISTPNLDRAMYHLAARGVTFNVDQFKYDAKGQKVAVYLQDEIGGFAFHLVQQKAG